MGRFGETLKQHRLAAGLSLRALGSAARLDFSYLSQVERGVRPPTRPLAEACDDALSAAGALVRAWQRQAGETDMRRRKILGAMGALAVAPAVAPLVGLESLRHGFGVAAGHADEWDRIVEDYGYDYYRLPADQLDRQLTVDMTVLQHQLAAADGPQRAGLLRAASKLSLMVAFGMVAAGQGWAAARWWRSARELADNSGDPDSVVAGWAWDVVNGCYDGRDPNTVVQMSDQALPLLHQRASAATCGLLAGRAQALSLAGRHTEAVATVERLSDLASQLPRSVITDVESVWGWPEHRLHYTASWVFTHAGRFADATRAQSLALALYPQSQARLRAQVQLHQAVCLIREGDIPDGLRLATDLLDALPGEHRNELLLTVARQVVDAVPGSERRRPAYGDLTAIVGAKGCGPWP
ncbi:XRE family transcriptional regulator [Micromonospora craniellae]|uniref:XRE family transcriptional regulator n=2 Tax=Micromonospora craniellae TaxID=2294034 RepID=A0A372G172_9ACTN|nr:helix-turn-helix domain-containing protein [Micromonospora craniellae]RFS46733.1 XRE family transcriptional regulator [Micromonospora craniellae]